MRYRFVGGITLAFLASSAVADVVPGPLRSLGALYLRWGPRVELGLTWTYRYDVDRFAHDDDAFQEAHVARRKELGMYLREPGVMDAVAASDSQANAWQDVFFDCIARHG